MNSNGSRLSMPPIITTAKSRVPIGFEVRNVESKGTSGSNSTQRGAFQGSQNSPFIINQGPLSTRQKGKPVEKRVITFGAVDFRQATTDRVSLSIEGSRTGEVVEVDPQVPRRSSESPSPSAELAALQKELKSCKSEIRNLTLKLQRKKNEKDSYRLLVDLRLEELAERLHKAEGFFMERESHRSDCSAGVHGLHSLALGSIRDQLSALQATLGSERERFESEMSTLTDQAKMASNSDEVDQLKLQIKELEKTLESERVRFTREKQVLEAEKAGVELVLNQTTIKLSDVELLRAEEQFMVQQCQQFVKNVCQPGFNVVKDSSLEPVDKNRSSPTGFVLVPLIILLHGYTLLPNEDRDNVITQYERQAAAL